MPTTLLVGRLFRGPTRVVSGGYNRVRFSGFLFRSGPAAIGQTLPFQTAASRHERTSADRPVADILFRMTVAVSPPGAGRSYAISSTELSAELR